MSDITKYLIKGLRKERPDYWAYSGRCYEYRDYMYNILKKLGYNVYQVESSSWVYDAKKFKKKVGVSETSMLNDPANNHAWLFYDGKHYDSMNTNGVENLIDMKFFTNKIKDDRYKPDYQDQYEYLLKSKIYDPKTDSMIKISKTNLSDMSDKNALLILLRITNKNSVIYFQLGDLFLKTNNKEMAIKCYKLALKTFGNIFDDNGYFDYIKKKIKKLTA